MFRFLLSRLYGFDSKQSSLRAQPSFYGNRTAICVRARQLGERIPFSYQPEPKGRNFPQLFSNGIGGDYWLNGGNMKHSGLIAEPHSHIEK